MLPSENEKTILSGQEFVFRQRLAGMGTPSNLSRQVRVVLGHGMCLVSYSIPRSIFDVSLLVLAFALAIFRITEINAVDMPRNTAIAVIQVMVGCAFILGFIYPSEKAGVGYDAGYVSTRSV